MVKTNKQTQTNICTILGLFIQTGYSDSPYGTACGVLAHLKPRESLISVHTDFTYLSEDISPQLWASTWLSKLWSVTWTHGALTDQEVPDMSELSCAETHRPDGSTVWKVNKSSLYLPKVRFTDDSRGGRNCFALDAIALTVLCPRRAERQERLERVEQHVNEPFWPHLEGVNELWKAMFLYLVFVLQIPADYHPCE